MKLIEAVKAIKDTDFKICRKKRNPDYDSLILDGDYFVRYSGEDPTLCLEDFEADDWYVVKEGQENTELKHCMCGGDAQIYTNKLGFFQAYCDKCHIQTPWYKTKEEVISAWNTRPIEEAKDEEITRLRNVLEDIRFNHPACFEDSDCPHKGGAGYDQGCLSCPWVIAEEVLKERGKQ